VSRGKVDFINEQLSLSRATSMQRNTQFIAPRRPIERENSRLIIVRIGAAYWEA